MILSEKRLRDTPDYRATVSNLDFLLPDSLIPRRSPIGLDSVIETAPRQRFVDFYRTWYRPERITLVAVGAIDPVTFATRIKEHFDSMRAVTPPRPNPDLGTISRRGPAARLYSDPDGQTRVSLESVSYADPGADTRASSERDIALDLANGVLSRRLASLALQGGASFISGAAHFNDWLRFARIASVDMQCKPEQWQPALAIAEQELRRALTYGFTAAELEEQKKNLLSAFEQQAKGTATRESPELANDLVEHLSEFNVFTDPRYDLAELQRVLPAITSERALQALRDLWQAGGGPLVFVTGPITLEQAEILHALKLSQAQPVTAPTDGAMQEFAYTDFGIPTQVVEKKVAPVLDVIQARFGNNVRLNLKRTQFEANSILLAIRFGGGRLELPRDKPGLKLLAEQAFITGGLQKHSLDELNRITAGRNVGLEFNVDDDAFVLSGHTTPDDLLLQLQVMTAYFTAPGYRPEALERFRQSLGPLYLNLTRTPGGVMQSQVARYLHDGDPRFGYPDRDEAAARTFEELKAWLSGPLTAGYLEISLVGDFDPDAALQAVASTFGSLPTRDAVKSPYTAQRQVRFPAEHQLKTFTFDVPRPQGLRRRCTGRPPISATSPRRGGCSCWPRRSRDASSTASVCSEGLSYTAQSANVPSQAFPGYGVLYALVDATPDKALELTRQIREIGARTARDGITEDELERARNPVVSELKKLLMDNHYLLSAIVSGSQEQPERLIRATTSLPELQGLTVADLNEVARKYLKPEDALPVVVTPLQTTGKASPTRPALRESALAPAH